MPSSSSTTDKIRLIFRTEHGPEHVALCNCDYGNIIKTAGQKLRLSNKVMKNARLVVEATGEGLLPNNHRNLSNGTVIIVYTHTRKQQQQQQQHQQQHGGTVMTDARDDKNKRSNNNSIDIIFEDLPLPPLAPSRQGKKENSLQHDLTKQKSFPLNEDNDHIDETIDPAPPPSDINEATNHHQQNVNKNKTTRLPVRSDYMFNGPFPILEGNIIPLLRECIAGSASFFTETDCGDYIAFDYKDATVGSGAFPNPKTSSRKNKERWLVALRRECRGLLVCSRTGQVLRRPFHKFFNINEAEETSQDKISLELEKDDNTTPTTLLEKIDGSLVSPFQLNDTIRWASRKMVQPKLEQYCASDDAYQNLARFCIDNNSTPLFEWCEAGQAVGVVRHKESSVTLLAIRDNITGAYHTRQQVENLATKFGVPCVNQLEPKPTDTTDISNLVAEIASRPAPLEGAVLILNNNHFYKIKTLWYVSMASAAKRGGGNNPWSFLQEFLEGRPSLDGVPSERIWKAALCDDATTSDDTRAICRGLLNSKEQAEQFQQFCELCDEMVIKLHEELCSYSGNIRDRLANKTGNGGVDVEAVINRVSTLCGWSRKVVRVYLQNNNPSTSLLRQDLMKETVCHLESKFGFRWDEARVSVERTDMANFDEEQPVQAVVGVDKHDEDKMRYIIRSQLFPADSLDVPPKGVADHVCTEYLTRKVANLLGKPKSSIMDETRIEFDSDYEGSEGKIKGLWEQFAKKNVVDLRIDLQPPLDGPVTMHNGNDEWALCLVQYGPSKVSKNSSRMKTGLKSGDFAGVFLHTNSSHRYSDLRAALRCSFQERRPVFLSSREAISKVPEIEDSGEGRLGKPGSQNNGDNQTQWTFFVDLDGVLADFDGALLESSGKRPGDFTDTAAMWRHIMSSERNFFVNLPWTEHGQKIWNLVQNAAKEEGVGEVKILTGVPSNKCGGKSAIRQKQAWCKEHLGEEVEVITCSSSEKHKWSGKKRILIDDHLNHRPKWEVGGGIFVHYSGNFHRLERQLRGLVYLHGGLSPNELEAISRVRDKASQTLEQEKGACYVEESHIRHVKGSDDAYAEAFASRVACLSEEFVGVDCEWKPDELSKRTGVRSAASVLQVAIEEIAYVIDLQEMSSTTRRALVNLFCPQEKALWTLGLFGVDEDLVRLFASVPEIVSFFNPETAPRLLDLQRICSSLGLVRSQKNLISLMEAMNQVAGLTLVKDQAVKASDWSGRPLNSNQIIYAASDARACVVMWEAISEEECLREAVLLSMTEILVVPPRSTLQKYSLATRSKSENFESNPAVRLANPAPILSALPTGTDPIRASYTGIFMSEDSSRRLLAAFPPKHRNKLCDHVTLYYAPQRSALAGLPIGRNYRLHISEIVSDDKSQVARVSILDQNGAGLEGFMRSAEAAHITISTAANVAASRSAHLLRLPAGVPGVDSVIVDDMVLEGTVGVHVQLTMDQDMLASLSKSVLQKLTDFAERSEPGSQLKFRGGMLSPAERAAIHAFCEKKGIQSRSEGPKDNRKMTLSFPKFASDESTEIQPAAGRIVQSVADLDDDKSNRKQSKRLRARDARNISKNYICLSMEIFKMIQWEVMDQDVSTSRSAVGELIFEAGGGGTKPEIHLDPNLPDPSLADSDEAILRSLVRSGELPPSTVSQGPVVIIMRGLPGSGKTSWAKALQIRCGGEQRAAMVSADAFFERKGSSYLDNFDRNKIGEAHDFCRARFAQEIENGRNIVIIVDNTNSTLSEYQFYVEKAKYSGKRVLVAEMLCGSNDEMYEFYHRGIHRVSMQDMGRMFGRWETDERSFMFKSAAAPRGGFSIASAVGPSGKTSLRSWLAENRMFHNVKGRQKTYLNMSEDPEESKFISVPEKLEVEFLRRYADDTSSWYLAEYATLPLFPFFCDFDQTYIHQNDAIDVLSVGSILASLLRDVNYRSVVIITGRLEEKDVRTGAFRIGCHLRCPNALVSLEEAMMLRAKLVETLKAKDNSSKDWDTIVDPTVYEHLTLRLVGSCKPGPQKRVYDLIGVIGLDGDSDTDLERMYRQDRLQLLVDCSIRRKEDGGNEVRTSP